MKLLFLMFSEGIEMGHWLKIIYPFCTNSLDISSSFSILQQFSRFIETKQNENKSCPIMENVFGNVMSVQEKWETVFAEVCREIASLKNS